FDSGPFRDPSAYDAEKHRRDMSGGGEIRTPEGVATLAVFKTAALNRARPPLQRGAPIDGTTSSGPTRPDRRRLRRAQDFCPARAISSSMIVLNASNGCAPESMRPLMKKAGVPFTPTAEPSAMSWSIDFWSFFATHSSNFLASRPTSVAIFFMPSGVSSPAKSFWLSSQYLPCALAQFVATAAGRAFEWNGSG